MAGAGKTTGNTSGRRMHASVMAQRNVNGSGTFRKIKQRRNVSARRGCRNR
jgi:hypothetical protein